MAKFNYEVRDIGLAKTGLEKIEWAYRNMPVLRAIEAELIEKPPSWNQGSHVDDIFPVTDVKAVIAGIIFGSCDIPVADHPDLGIFKGRFRVEPGSGEPVQVHFGLRIDHTGAKRERVGRRRSAEKGL